MNCILSIDSGGSKCDVMLLDMSGKILGWGNAQLPGLGGRNSHSIRRAIEQAMVFDRFDTMHVTSLGWLLPSSALYRVEAGQILLVPTSEEESALAHAGVDWGVVLLAGTGAFAHYRSPEGKNLHFDGAGPMLGDFGSGFHVGTMALHAVIRSDWHPRHATSLRERVLDTLGVDRPMALIEKQLFVQDRSLVAALSRIVNEEATNGDAIANQILAQAADALAETFRDLAERADICDRPLTVVGTGSLIRQVPIYRERLWQRIREIAPNATVIAPEEPPVVSLSILALKHCLGDNAAPAIEHLLQHARQWLNPTSQEPTT